MLSRTAIILITLTTGCVDAAVEPDPPAGRTNPTVQDPGDAPPVDTWVAEDRGFSPIPINLTAVWAIDGGDKVTRDELRATTAPSEVVSARWDGSKVQLFGARGEVLGFNLVLEAATATALQVSVRLTELTGSGGARIASEPAGKGGLFDWRSRPIELFYVRYLPIRGLSMLGYTATYDERHVPERFRRPWTGDGLGAGGWEDRPDHDKEYPDILVPLELHPTFDVAAGTNQSVWVDVFIPPGTPPGAYMGRIEVREAGAASWSVPIHLEVRDFDLPSVPSARTLLVLATQDINSRYLGEPYPYAPEDLERSERIVDRHVQLAWRHRITAVDSFADAVELTPADTRRLDGSLFTPQYGYEGPGAGQGIGLHVIGLYGSWTWQWDPEDPADMQAHATGWVTRMAKDFPDTEYFLFLADEPLPPAYAQIEQWARWIDESPGLGRALPTFSTVGYVEWAARMPSLDIPCRAGVIGEPTALDTAYSALLAGDHPTCGYGGMRPATGILVTEEDGVGPRALAWTQYKHRVGRWFAWNATYYDDFQAGNGPTNVFREARTFGGKDDFDSSFGESGWNHTNGDGVLMYPGTDRVFPEESYGASGPFASLRLKLWRRGLQDVDYLHLAAKVDPLAVSQIVTELVPKVLWEVGVTNPVDPSYVYTDISWPTDPDVWEATRALLADIIDGGTTPARP